MTITLHPDIQSSNWQLSTSEDGAVVRGVEDLKQQVLNCLSTDKGTVPFAPNDGFNINQLLDEPVNWVIPNGKLGILDALENGVPLITVNRIQHVFSQYDPSTVIFIVHCVSNLGNFEVAISNNPNFTPQSSQGGFSSGFSSGFFI
jgi:phage baseplate assembly protein W